MKRRAIAALGELLFYIATPANNNNKNKNNNNNNISRNWKVPAFSIRLVEKCLRPNEDPIVRQYAAKTIENVCLHIYHIIIYVFLCVMLMNTHIHTHTTNTRSPPNPLPRTTGSLAKK